jgi:hypothetical protein
MDRQQPKGGRRKDRLQDNSVRDKLYEWVSNFDADILYLCGGSKVEFDAMLNSGTINDLVLKIKHLAHGHRQDNTGIRNTDKRRRQKP